MCIIKRRVTRCASITRTNRLINLHLTKHNHILYCQCCQLLSIVCLLESIRQHKMLTFKIIILIILTQLSYRTHHKTFRLTFCFTVVLNETVYTKLCRIEAGNGSGTQPLQRSTHVVLKVGSEGGPFHRLLRLGSCERI